MTTYTYPAKVYLLVALLGVATLLYAAARLAEAKDYQDPYPFRTQVVRLREVRAALNGQRTAGYTSNLEEGERGYTSLYFPTQYLIAPTLLVPIQDNPSVTFVLGNFTRQLDYAAHGRALGLAVVQEYPMGVVLYRKAARTGNVAAPGSIPSPPASTQP